MRKTEEIKLRVTTLEKESWQALAAEANTTVSELIRRMMNREATYQRASEPMALDPDALHGAVDSLREPPEYQGDIDRRGRDKVLCVLTEEGFIPILPATEPQCSPGGKAACAFPECDDGSCHPRGNLTGCVTPVEFTNRLPVTPLHAQPDRRETASRRETVCSCGKPTWIFCGSCDA